MAEKKQLTATQRANNFAMMTRQNLQMLPKQTVTDGATTMQFNLPKARLLSKIMMRVSAKVKISHATSTSYACDDITPFKILRRISLDCNNGFSPFIISGEQLATYNLIHVHPETMKHDNSNSQAYIYSPDSFTVSSTGTSTEMAITCELPIAINDRDAVGLILLQNDQTNVTLTVDVANGSELVDNTSGYTVDIEKVEVTPMVETFSIPNVGDAVPDISVLKLVSGRVENFAGSGQNVIKLNTGTIYRRIIFKITDADGDAFADSDISGNIDLVFNQADANYSITPEMLRQLNTRMLGYELPKGFYCFDFANCGNGTGYSGTRDYIDTANLTEFWLRFNSTNGGKITIVTETLTRLV